MPQLTAITEAVATGACKRSHALLANSIDNPAMRSQLPSLLLVMLRHGSLLQWGNFGATASMQANPHKRVRQLYGGRMMTSYRGVPLGELSPHVYAIAEQVRHLTHLHVRWHM